MKSLTKYVGGLALLSLLTVVGCEKDFEKINTNPNNTKSAPTPYIMTYAQRHIAYFVNDVWYSGRQASLACQQWSQRNYTSEDRYSFREATMDGFFRNMYIWMYNYQAIIGLNTDPATKDAFSIYGDNAMQIATAEIMKAWGFQLLTDAFGDVPYSQALQPDKYPTPKFDAQQDIYDDLIAKLTAAATALQGSNGWATGDILYGGDVDQWIKFANSLRLRLALRASKVNSAKYMPIALDAIADGVFTSNADDAIVQFAGAGEPNEAPVYNGFIVNKRNDFTLTKQFVNLMKGLDDAAKGFVNPLNGIVDPRLAVYRGPWASNATRVGIPYGMSDAETKQYVTANSVINLRPSYTLSLLPYNLQPDFSATYLDFATVSFMACEVEGWSRARFQAGVEASLAKLGITDLAYVASVLAKYDAATTDAQRAELVITQKYIHLYNQPYEAWSEYRRTGFPKSIVKPGEVTAVVGGNNILFTPVNGKESGNDIVARFKYGISEYVLNRSNVEAAATAMGGDDHKHKVWWAGGGSQ
ncbi:SusD/RagB family nutrient-binding outer membrane lipoprotein [Williamwhitmania taraxaci]|uniref:Susd and RagB outer membrane lipoprotein n=1 Tax=Williamwhitmania taraxaci TaxID=1640674 RepID=A0A1G6HIM6_9BACT|nr:SusD/RagB family nutrient-binding outer membrane lipoprotein [Williamwhitmania taraxaci]SDB93296.1 Susd and RagB outer membrane lipoprotein [Williamwhitmania taraxaci]